MGSVSPVQVQSQYEIVVKRFNQEQKEVEDLLQTRDQAYLDLLAASDGQAVVPKQLSPQKGRSVCGHALRIVPPAARSKFVCTALPCDQETQGTGTLLCRLA